jgi:hypothetical protein
LRRLAQDHVELGQIEAVLPQGVLEVLGQRLRGLELLLVLHLLVKLLRLLWIKRSEGARLRLLAWALVLQVDRLRSSECLA